MDKRFLAFYQRILIGLVTATIALLVCAVGCDSDTRYKMLTFFFEGVPDPNAKTITPVSDANGIAMTSVQMQNLKKNTGQTVSIKKLGQKQPSSHEIVKDCTHCHTGDLYSGKQELKETLPDLCYFCHTDLYRPGDYLHGPLNVGECLVCHDPHQSAYIHLQKAPEPQLCFRCHQQADIATIPNPNHQELLKKVCTDCHDPHASSVPQLLKAGPGQQNDPNSADLEKIK